MEQISFVGSIIAHKNSERVIFACSVVFDVSLVTKKPALSRQRSQPDIQIYVPGVLFQKFNPPYASQLTCIRGVFARIQFNSKLLQTIEFRFTAWATVKRSRAYLQSFLNSSATNWTLGPIMT